MVVRVRDIQAIDAGTDTAGLAEPSQALQQSVDAMGNPVSGIRGT